MKCGDDAPHYTGIQRFYSSWAPHSCFNRCEKSKTLCTHKWLQFLLVDEAEFSDKVVEVLVARVDVRFLHIRTFPM